MAALTFKVGGDTSGLKRALAGAKGALMGLGNVANNLKIGTKIAGAVSAIGGIGIAFQAVKKAADMEQLETAFGVLTGSAKEGSKAIEELMKFSDSTPLKAEEVVAAGRSLLAFGVGTDELVDSLKMVGEVSQGIGAPLGEIAEIYGKARVQGRLFGEDINQLTGRGIPIVSELAEVLGVSAEKVKGLVSEGKVGFPELEKAFQAMTGEGGKFSGLLEKQSQTFSGLFSTLIGKINAVLRNAGKGLMEALKGPMSDLIGFLDGIQPKIKKWAEAAGDAISLIVEAFRANALPGLLKDGLLVAGKSLVNTVARGFKAIIGGLMAALGQIPAFFAAGMRVVVNPKFWESAGNTLAAGIRKTSVAVTQALPDWMAPGPKLSEQGAAKVQDALTDFGKVSAMEALTVGMDEIMPMIEEARAKMEKALVRAAESEDVLDVSGNRESMKKTWESLKKIVEERKAEAEAIEEVEKAKKNVVPEEETGALGAVLGAVRPVVSSLGRIGGAAIRGGRADTMDRERNALLKKIAANTDGDVIARYA